MGNRATVIGLGTNRMVALIGKVFAVFLVVLVVAGVWLWLLGARQPSQAISRYEKVIFLALKHKQPAHIRTAGSARDAVLWSGRVAFPFIGPDDPYWTEYIIFTPDSSVLSELENSTHFEDLFAAEVKLVKVPALALGVLRAQHKLGLSRRPDGPIPQSVDEAEGRLDILPTIRALDASRAAPPDMQITMVNYLEYIPAKNGGKDQGRRTYNKYGFEAMRAVHMVGGQFLFAGRITNVLIEPKNESTPGDWDDLAAMIYPDPMAIFYMEQSPRYKNSMHFRDESLERTVVIATEAH
jgi:hypothetical protein